MAPLVIGAGPGFAAGEDVDVVIETMRGYEPGKAIYQEVHWKIQAFREW